MNKLVFVIVISCLATSLLPGCKKDMPPVVAARWSAMEDLARAAGPICDKVLALPQCPLEPDHLPHPDAPPIVRLPTSPLIGATEVREVEVYCELKPEGHEVFTHSCYLQHYFDPHSPQRDVASTCDKKKPYPGWENTKDGLEVVSGLDCRERLYWVSLLRRSPAGHTVHARAYFYIDGHPPAVAPTPAPP
jgi:hypothetical protein